MAWKWSGEGQRNKNRAAISRGALKAVWHCKACGRGQQGGWHNLGDARNPLWRKICRYCKAVRGEDQPEKRLEVDGWEG